MQLKPGIYGRKGFAMTGIEILRQQGVTMEPKYKETSQGWRIAKAIILMVIFISAIFIISVQRENNATLNKKIERYERVFVFMVVYFKNIIEDLRILNTRLQDDINAMANQAKKDQIKIKMYDQYLFQALNGSRKIGTEYDETPNLCWSCFVKFLRDWIADFKKLDGKIKAWLESL
jgi:hypothetical protein